MNLFLLAASLAFPGAEPLQAMDLNLGLGAILLRTGGEGFGQNVFGGATLEASHAQKHGDLWFETGISGVAGAELGMNSGSSSDEILGGGLHFDASYSIVGWTYLDLKAGLGIGAKYIRREQRDNDMDENHRFYLVSRRITHRFGGCARGLLAINIHGSDGIGGIEIRPFKLEIGVPYSAITPSVAVYWPI